MLPQRVRIADRALFRGIEDEMVILDLAEEQYYGLDDVGARMWKLLSEHGDTATVVSQLQAYYNVDEPTLTRDLDSFVEKLIGAGLVVVDDEESRRAQTV
jgi:hypothetical protein